MIDAYAVLSLFPLFVGKVAGHCLVLVDIFKREKHGLAIFANVNYFRIPYPPQHPVDS